MTTTASAASKIAERYATALIETGEQSKTLESIEKDLESLITMVESSEDLTSLIKSPLYNGAQQTGAIQAIAQKAGFNKLTSNFLGVLAQNRRLNILKDVISAFRAQLSHRRGEVLAKVTTAFPLTPEQERYLQDSLKKSLGFKVTLQVTVDPSILGGMIVTVGSKMVDDSVRRKLERLKLKMQSSSNQNTKLEEVG